MKIMKELYKKVLLVLVACYVICIFTSQQQTLNNYKKDINNYEVEILQAKETQSSLVAMKDNINSPEYIEDIAREKLGMYLPNERVYIDIGK